MRKLKVGKVRRVSTFGHGDNMVNGCRHWMRGAECFIDWLTTDCADVLSCKDYLLVGFELRTVRAIPIRAVHDGGHLLSNDGGWV